MSVVLAQTTGKWKDEKYTVRTKGYLKCWQAAFKKCLNVNKYINAILNAFFK